MKPGRYEVELSVPGKGTIENASRQDVEELHPLFPKMTDEELSHLYRHIKVCAPLELHRVRIEFDSIDSACVR